MFRHGKRAALVLVVTISALVASSHCAGLTVPSSLGNLLRHAGNYGVVRKEGALHAAKYDDRRKQTHSKLYHAVAKNKTEHGLPGFSADLVGVSCLLYVNTQ